MNLPLLPPPLTNPACINEDPELFFQNGRETPEQTAAREADAKAVCADCPAREACLERALEDRDGYAILGGTNPEERRAIIRSRKRAGRPVKPRPLQPIEHGTPLGYAAHRRRGQSACDACLAAERVYKAERLAARNAVA